MPNCRSIQPAAWEHARKALVFYFSRRHGIANAEDLAHETITAVLTRDDYQFASDEDFLRVCYGFASRISQSGHRRTRRDSTESLPDDWLAPQCRHVSLNPAEMTILLGEVISAGETKLSTTDWELVRRAGTIDRASLGQELKLGDANNVRVRLFRARKRLARLTGWYKEPAAVESAIKKDNPVRTK